MNVAHELMFFVVGIDAPYAIRFNFGQDQFAYEQAYGKMEIAKYRKYRG